MSDGNSTSNYTILDDNAKSLYAFPILVPITSTCQPPLGCASRVLVPVPSADSPSGTDAVKDPFTDEMLASLQEKKDV
jgi:hypothetical protein